MKHNVIIREIGIIPSDPVHAKHWYEDATGKPLPAVDLEFVQRILDGSPYAATPRRNVA